MFKWDFLYFNLCPFHLVLSLGTNEKSLALSYQPPHCFDQVHTRNISPKLSLLNDKQSLLSEYISGAPIP